MSEEPACYERFTSCEGAGVATLERYACMCRASGSEAPSEACPDGREEVDENRCPIPEER